MLARKLIHSEKQFSNIKKNLSRLPSELLYDQNNFDVPILLIVTTQRTGSTLLCQDLEQSCSLEYKPEESFVPPLVYLFKNYPNHDPVKLKEIFDKSFLYPSKGPLYVHKVMIDYIGWLGFLYAPRNIVQNSTYVELCLWSIEFILSKSNMQLPIVFLDRTDKISQASSRLINSFGFKTHLFNNEEKDKFKMDLKNKLQELPHKEGMLLDQASIILKQNDLLEIIRENISKKFSTVRINYEDDICDSTYDYLYKFVPRDICDTSLISRKLKKTANSISDILKKSVKDKLGLQNEY